MLPAQCTLRPATAADIWPIRRLVWGAKLDPTQLRWQQFWVVTDPQTVIACGQLRAFSQAQELGSLVVAQPWRGQGLGSHLTQSLVAQATQPLYLECLGSSLPRFYRRFGFQSIAWSDLPTPLRFKFAPASLGPTLGFPLEVMVRRPVFPLHQG